MQNLDDIAKKIVYLNKVDNLFLLTIHFLRE